MISFNMSFTVTRGKDQDNFILFVRPLYCLCIFVVNPFLTLPFSHGIIKMSHKEEIIKGFAKVWEISWCCAQAHGEAWREIGHLMPVTFGHIQAFPHVLVR